MATSKKRTTKSACPMCKLLSEIGSGDSKPQSNLRNPFRGQKRPTALMTTVISEGAERPPKVRWQRA